MKNQVAFFIGLLFLVYTGESMRYRLISELVVAASANEVWAFFASNDAPKLFMQLLPGVFERIEILEGDAGVGSILLIVNPAGYLDMGVAYFMESFQISKKGANSCIIKSMINYEVPDDLASNVSHLMSIEGLINIAKVAAKYIIDNKNKASSIADM
ncbi:hypothetical protein MKX01_002109 [Papaver californicum]|nr:hypothetical protein MKX01_002109 [Papaver californicum]